jgi:histidyl-tRNA synthetase
VRLPTVEAKSVVDWLQLRDLEAVAGEVAAESPALAELRRLLELLDAYGLADRVEFDASIVRGLAYYTGIVFEAFDRERKLRAICGGGRYDHLVETLGGPPIPAVGFGFGDSVIAELLSDRGLLPECPRTLDAAVYAFGDTERPAAVRLASTLRGDGRSVELVLGPTKLKRALADADRAGARCFYLIGPDELARGIVVVRDLQTGNQTEEPLPS